MAVSIVDRARELYYFDHLSLAEVGEKLVEEGMFPEGVTGVQAHDRVRNEFRKRKWPRRDFSEVQRERAARKPFRGQLCEGAKLHGPEKGEPCGQNALEGSRFCWGHADDRALERHELMQRMRGLRDLGPLVSIDPFIAWCDQRRRELLGAQADPHFNATGWGLLAKSLDVDLSQLTKLCKQRRNTKGEPIEHMLIATIRRWLARDGSATFEAIYDRHCPACGGEKSPRSSWCRACVARLRGEDGKPVALLGENATVCPSCGGEKSGESTVCWTCYAAQGSHTGRSNTKRSLQKIDDRTLLEARELYDSGLSMRVVARRLLPRTRYKNERSAASAMFELFRTRGWPMRERGAATAAANRSKHDHLPRCRHPGGCEIRTGRDNGYCHDHDPATIERERARKRIQRGQLAA
jgi:hypothetical protein